MLSDKRILAVVPARGGSKGIPLKNLRPVLNVPMVARVGHVIAELPIIDRAVVSTDHEEIARVAEDNGLAAPFRRPESLSGDRIGDKDVLVHALTEIERLDSVEYDIVVMLQPTSPMRRSEDVLATITKHVEEGWDAVWSLSESDSKAHPLKQLTLDDNQTVDHYDRAGANIIARQQLTPVYHRNGVAYSISRECLLEQGTIKGLRTGGYVVPGIHVSVDTEWDIELAEFVMQREGRQ